MPGKSKDHNPSGLGRAIINRQTRDARKRQESGLYTTDSGHGHNLQSITQERDLDEFLNTAQLAGTDFAAERRNIKIIPQSTGISPNPYLLSEQEEIETLAKHSKNKTRLRVPRRPPWVKSMTVEELDKQEKASFLNWRRGLAKLQEEDKFLLTPFERNIEVWRQLWRVVERSYLIVQIVDARNPLRFRCEDLESYVLDVEGTEGEAGTGKGKRRNLLLINKADLLTLKQRTLWADYFEREGIQYGFFSAAKAAALQQDKIDEAVEGLNELNIYGNMPEISEDVSKNQLSDSASDEEGEYFSATDDDETHVEDPRTRILSVGELESLFISSAPELSEFTASSGHPPTTLVVGLVGYPNVGKSSTINSLLGAKKVSVSATPGKTKHFQTISLSDKIVLCDCPGLVFPQFATTKADLVCDGVLPVDQLREYTGPIALLVKRIPKDLLETKYGLSIAVKGIEEGGDGNLTAEDLLKAYASARGFMRSGQGNPDEARAARYILKDYINGALLFCHPPPGVAEKSYNEDSRRIMLMQSKKKYTGFTAETSRTTGAAFVPSRKVSQLDREFFQADPVVSLRPFIRAPVRGGESFSRAKLYPTQNLVAEDGTHLTTRAPIPSGFFKEGKKHKKPKRAKQRSGQGYD